MALQNVSTFLRQDDERAVVSGSRCDLHEAGFFQVPQVAGAWIERALLTVSQIAGGDDAESTDDGERLNSRRMWRARQDSNLRPPA
jgi:hypothetical protein